MKKQKIYFEVLKLTAGVFIFCILLYLGGTGSMLSTFTPRPGPLALCFIATFLLFYTTSSRWGFIVNALSGRKLSGYFEYLYFLITGFFYGQFISQFGGTLLVRPGMLMKREDISYKKSVSSVIIEKAFDLVLVLVLIGPSVLYIFDYISTFNAFLWMGILFVVLNTVFIYFNSWLTELIGTVLRTALLTLEKIPLLRRIPRKDYYKRLEDLTGAPLLRKKPLVAVLLFTVIKQLFLFFRYYFLCSALNIDISPATLFMGIPVAQLSLLIAFTPGSIGVLEAGWYAVLKWGSPLVSGDISVFILGQRIYWFLFIALIYLLVFLVARILKLKKTFGLFQKEVSDHKQEGK